MKTRHNLHISKPFQPDLAKLDKIGLSMKPTVERGPMILLAIRFAVGRLAEFRKFVASK